MVTPKAKPAELAPNAGLVVVTAAAPKGKGGGAVLGAGVDEAAPLPPKENCFGAAVAEPKVDCAEEPKVACAAGAAEEPKVDCAEEPKVACVAGAAEEPKVTGVA